MRAEPSWAALASRQHGTITTQQLRSGGVSTRGISELERAGALRREGLGVYVVAGSPATWRQELAVAVHRGGPTALVGARSAAALHCLHQFREGHVEVLSPWRTGRTDTPTRIWRTTDLAQRDRTVVDGLPTTSATRTLIDMGRFVGAGLLTSLIDDAVRRDLTTYEAVHERCGELARRGRPGIATVRVALRTRFPGAAVSGSDFETRVRTLILRAGIPDPVLQHPVGCDEFTYVLDLAWPSMLVAVECDGFRFHRTPEQLDWDARRQNELALRGWLVHRVTWRQLREDPDTLVRTIGRAIRSRAA